MALAAWPPGEYVCRRIGCLEPGRGKRSTTTSRSVMLRPSPTTSKRRPSGDGSPIGIRMAGSYIPLRTCLQALHLQKSTAVTLVSMP